MRWQGFLTESKKYMNHPDYWKEWEWYDPVDCPTGWTMAGRQRAKLRFWVQFPLAWVKFHWYWAVDLCKQLRLA